MKKRKGQVGIVFSIFMVVFLVIVIAVLMQLYQYRVISRRTEDALAASNLASAIIDVEEYGISHNILIDAPDGAYLTYQGALKSNMQLDDSWMSSISAISGRIEILDYIIYNVRGNDIEIYCYGTNPYQIVEQGGLGSVYAPNGKKVVSTSIYSRITFPVKGFFDMQTTAVKDMLVDIVNN